MKRAQWSQEKKDQLISLYEDHTMAECCKILGAGQVVVMRYMEELGIESRKAARRPVPQPEIDEMVRLYLEGHSQDSIAKELNCSQGKVGRLLRSQNIESRHMPLTEEVQKQVVDYYLEDESRTLAGTAKHFSKDKRPIRECLLAHGIQIRTVVRKGNQCWNWQGGRILDKSGYVYIHSPDHPNKNNSNYVFEHRLVMEKKIGRYLTRKEVVHHIDKDHSNNDIDNLMLFACNADHLAYELAGQCPNWSEDGKRRLRKAQQQKRKKSHQKSDAQG